MALTIQQTPGSYYSVNEDLLYTVVDLYMANDPVNYPDFRYVADIYIGTDLIMRDKKYPRPDNKIGVFNVASIVRNYVANNFSPVANTVGAQSLGLGEFYAAVQVKFGYEYGFVLYPDVVVDSVRNFYNHYNGNTRQLTVLGSYMDKPLTVRPFKTAVMTTAAYCFLPYFATAADDLVVNIKTYRADGSLQNTYNYTETPVANTARLYNVAPAAINAGQAGTITAATSYYTVQITKTVPVGSEPVYRFDLKCEAKYEVFTLHFMNRFGNMESREFTKVSRKSLQIEKKDYGRLPYTIDASGIVSYANANNVQYGEHVTYSSQYSEKLIINTDILTDAEYRWLSDLVLSPMVYIEDNGFFLPITIKENNYDFRKAVNDKLTNLTLNIEFGGNYNTQYR